MWPTRAACFAESDAKTPALAFKAQACFERQGCAADRACLDVVPPVCEAYYARAATVCDARGSWPASFALLAATCDPTLFGAVTATDEVAECLAARGCDGLERRPCPTRRRRRAATAAAGSAAPCATAVS